jgi:hypothetical protein
VTMFVDAEIDDDEAMLNLIGELPADLRESAFMLALVVTAGDSDG